MAKVALFVNINAIGLPEGLHPLGIRWTCIDSETDDRGVCATDCNALHNRLKAVS